MIKIYHTLRLAVSRDVVIDNARWDLNGHLEQDQRRHGEDLSLFGLPLGRDVV